MTLQHVLLFGYGAFRLAFFGSAIHTAIAYPLSVDKSLWEIYWPLLGIWFGVLWLCSITARLLELWYGLITNHKDETFPRKTYINYGSLSVFWLVLVLFLENPIFALIKKHLVDNWNAFLDKEV